jgi:carbonic anhydrase
MSFKYPEIKTEGEDDAAVRSSNGWDAKCSSFELLDDNIKYGKKKKPQQSPININTKTVQECSTLCNLEINYKPGKCRIDKYEDNLIRMIHDEGSYIKFGENNYELKFIFFHTPGNHLIDGKNSHMEINFYHGIMEELDIKRVEEARNIKIKNKHNHKHYHAHTDGLEDNNLNGRKKGVVLSVMVDVDHSDDNQTRGTKPNICLSQFIHTDAFRDLKPDEDPIEINVGKKWSIEQLLPEKKAFYTYNGSIAMPPCTENYAWVVFDEHISIISEYLKMFRIIGNPKGNREAHPLNDRMIFFNPNVKVVEKEIEDEDKSSFIEKRLSPIRIMYDNRAGSEYRVRADYVINKYMNGDNVGWHNDQTKLQDITTDWDKASKIGYDEIQVSDMTELRNSTTVTNFEAGSNSPNLSDVVLDYYIYNSMDYLDYYINNILVEGSVATTIPVFDEYHKKVINMLNAGGSIFKNIYVENGKDYQTDIDEVAKNFDMSQGTHQNNICDYLYRNNESSFEPKTGDDLTIWQLDPSRPNNKVLKSDVEFVLNYFSGSDSPPSVKGIDGNNVYRKVLLYILYCWNQTTNGGEITQAMEILDNNTEDSLKDLRKQIMYKLLYDFYENPATKPVIFRVKKGELSNTIDGDQCQTWGSNSTHYEGNLLEFWKDPLKMNSEGYEFGNMTPQLKEAAKDGLLIFKDGKFKPHNKCRNPGNEDGAPWCYTKNPKVRWQYCAIPDFTSKNRYWILIIVFLMLIILSIFLVKLIFRNEYFSEIVAKITGGKVTSQTVTGSMSAPEVPSTTMAAAATSAARML